jgi:hypothetical protein
MKNIITQIINDTLKKEGKFSRTSLTMFSSWFVSLVMSTIDFAFNGLRFDVWCVLVGVALGSKITDSFSKKIEK